MLRFFFKGKRKIPQHQLVIESSLRLEQKRIFLNRYIWILSLGIVYLFWINGHLNQSHNWSYYFQLNKQGQFVEAAPLEVPQPYSKDEIIDRAKALTYKLFSVTPKTYQTNYNQVFADDFFYQKFIKDTYEQLVNSGLIDRLKSGWYFSVESFGDETVNGHQINLGNNKPYAWQVTFHNFVLYGRNRDSFTKTKGDLKIVLVKTPFMNSPDQLSVVSVFLANAEDVGSKYGY